MLFKSTDLTWLCYKVRVIGEPCALDEARGWRMNDFKGRHFEGEIVLWAVRWDCRYPISYRDLESMMTERGVAVDHSTIYRWVQQFAPEMEKRLRWPRSSSWRVDETYIKVRGPSRRICTVRSTSSGTRSISTSRRRCGTARTAGMSRRGTMRVRRSPGACRCRAGWRRKR